MLRICQESPRQAAVLPRGLRWPRRRPAPPGLPAVHPRLCPLLVCGISSTVIRVPRITGFPIMMAGLISIRSVLIASLQRHCSVPQLRQDEPTKNRADPEEGAVPVIAIFASAAAVYASHDNIGPKKSGRKSPSCSTKPHHTNSRLDSK
jgi:hypothetical protein